MAQSNLNNQDEAFGGIAPTPKYCKTCIFRNGLPPYADGYLKGYCDIYAYPTGKPFDVYFNGAECEYYEETDNV